MPAREVTERAGCDMEKRGAARVSKVVKSRGCVTLACTDADRDTYTLSLGYTTDTHQHPVHTSPV